MTDFVNLPPKRAALLQAHAALPVRIIGSIRVPLGLRAETIGFGQTEFSLPACVALRWNRLIPTHFITLKRGILRMKNRAAQFVVTISIGAGKTARHAEQQHKE